MSKALIFLVIFLFSASFTEAQTIDSKLKIILQKKDSKKKVAELNTESELLWNKGEYDLSKSYVIEEIKPSKQPIGQFEHSVPFETTSRQLEKEDTIYLFSDGFADQFGGDNGKKMMSKRMKEIILSIQHEPLIKQRQLLDDFFENWKGKLDQLDDVCVIGIRV
jgi:hypothetical protein